MDKIWYVYKHKTMYYGLCMYDVLRELIHQWTRIRYHAYNQDWVYLDGRYEPVKEFNEIVSDYFNCSRQRYDKDKRRRQILRKFMKFRKITSKLLNDVSLLSHTDEYRKAYFPYITEEEIQNIDNDFITSLSYIMEMIVRKDYVEFNKFIDAVYNQRDLYSKYADEEYEWFVDDEKLITYKKKTQ